MSAKQSPATQPDFIAGVRSAFAFLESFGFHEAEAVTGMSFDNARVVFESPALLIAIQRERGDITADFASIAKPGQWGRLELVLDHLDGPSGAARYDLSGPDALRNLASLIRGNLTRVAPLFTPAAIVHTLARLHKLSEERAERLWPSRRS